VWLLLPGFHTPAGRTAKIYLSGVQFEDGETLFYYLHLHVLGFKKLHKVVQMPALQETGEDNKEYQKNVSEQ